MERQFPVEPRETLAADWAIALAPVAQQISALDKFLSDETVSGRPYLPSAANVLRAFQSPLANVRVLIVGQDPYPTPGHPVGLSFAVERSVRPLPRSLQNIYRELNEDLDIPPALHGDLTGWAANGVLLLNRVLSVEAGKPGSHRGRGWEQVTEAAIRALAARGGPLVAILWGRDAAGLTSILGDTPTIRSAHPSPLSAHRGFFGSRPFSRANELLLAQGAPPVDWRVTP